MATDYVGLAFGTGDQSVDRVALRAAVSGAVGPGAKVRARGRAVLALLDVDSGEWSSDGAESLRRAVGSEIDRTVSVGIGGPRPRGAGPYGVAYQAEQALALGRALFGDGRVTHYDELGPYAFVLGRPTFELRAYCERVLGPLSDPRHRDLMRTLEEFVRSHGSLNEVARRMFLHRNTVRQRLRRIGDLTGADLSDHEDRLSLQLALLGCAALERMGEDGPPGADHGSPPADHRSAHRTDLAEAP